MEDSLPTRSGRLAVCLLVGVAFPAFLAAQPISARPDLGVRWSTSSTTPPLEVHGVVINADTGEGLQSAQVYFEGTGVGALTNQDGRFQLTAPRAGQFRLAVELIGYRRTIGTIALDEDVGVAVLVATAQQPISNCGLIICAYPGCESGVRVEVRAFDTGLAPEGEITLAVRAGDRSATTTGYAPARDTLYLRQHSTSPEFQASFDSTVAQMPARLFTGGDISPYGPFDVTVSAQSYTPWTASDVWLTDRECLPRVSPLLRVWLLPS